MSRTSKEPDGCEIVRLQQRFEFFAQRSGIPLQDSADIAQEAVRHILQEKDRDTFRSSSGFNTWAIGIFKHKLADYWRARQRLHALQHNGEIGLISAGRVAPLNQETRILVREALRHLSGRHRAALVLNKLEGYTAIEIERMTGTPAGTVSRLVREAMKEFRNIVLSRQDRRIGERLLESDS